MVFSKHQHPATNTNTNLRVSSSLQDLSSYRHHHIDATTLAAASFSKTKPLPRQRCLFLILLLPLLYTLYSRSHASAKYYFVLDCGSTGTRVYVYKAQIHHRPNTNLPIAIHSLKDGLRHYPASARARAYSTSSSTTSPL